MDLLEDKEALFRSLHGEYYPMVRQLCLGYMNGQATEAEDMAQEVFINVWNGLDKFRGQSSHKTWIYRIAVNTCLLQLRNVKSAPTLELDNSLAGPAHEPAQEEERIQVLYRTIGKLPHVERLIIMLVLEELPYEEIGSITGISPVHLRVKIHRIKNKLRQLIKQP